MTASRHLLDFYTPPKGGFVLVSLVASTYKADFEFIAEDLLPVALEIRGPGSRMQAFRSELERALQHCHVSILFDISDFKHHSRTSPRIDAIPVALRKLHAKITLQLWMRPEPNNPKAERRIRLVIGSANLTRLGFRENYECAAAFEFGERRSLPREPLFEAIELLRGLSAETNSPQLKEQLDEFGRVALRLPDGMAGDGQPSVRFATAESVLPALMQEWREISQEPPDRLTIVSPFWPEGASAAGALREIVERLGSAQTLELVCRGVPSSDGKLTRPEFDPVCAAEFKAQYPGKFLLRAALPDYGSIEERGEDVGDGTEEQELSRTRSQPQEEISRNLHAKLIAISSRRGMVLYMGSSNCTRRGLALTRPANVEAGLIYRFGPGRSRFLDDLLAFAGPPVEVLSGHDVSSVKPEPYVDSPSPTFLAAVTARGTTITISFRTEVPLPGDLRITMEDPTGGDNAFWLLFPTMGQAEVQADLRCAPYFGSDGEPRPVKDADRIVPNVEVRVEWDGNSMPFPVRFDDKNALPVLLRWRTLTEGELVDYYLFGREPPDLIEDAAEQADTEGVRPSDGPVDTGRILSYFIRRFVQAIPGIEAEVRRLAYSRPTLESALRGPTSPLALAERAAASLQAKLGPSEPRKTAIAVGFQLVEILAALVRSRAAAPEELRDCFDPVVERCRALLDELIASHEDLRTLEFERYRRTFVEETP